MHKILFDKTKEAVDDRSNVQIAHIQVCEICGYMLESNASDKRPLCGVSKEKFTAFEWIYLKAQDLKSSR